MALYKALNADRKSIIDDQCGTPSEAWVVGEWHEITGPLRWDINNTSPRNGLFCSDDILQCMYGEFPRFIAAVETDGESIVHGKTQVWEKMRVTSIKAWGHNKACLVLDWAEGRSHDYWAGRWPTEATLYDMKHYQGQYQDMLDIIFPVFQSLYYNGEAIPAYELAGPQQRLKPEFTQQVSSRINMERIVTMAYLLPQMLLNMKEMYGGGAFAYWAEQVCPGAWEIVRGFTEDHWGGLPEV